MCTQVWFEVGPLDAGTGARNVTVAGIMNGPGPPLPPKPNKCHRGVCPSNVTQLYAHETLDVRVIVDRPSVEVFVLGGRIAWVHDDNQVTTQAPAAHATPSGRTMFDSARHAK